MFLLFSCTNNVLFRADTEINNSWHTDSLIEFNLNISDTTTVYYSEINIRHNNNYPFQNLFVFIHTTNPLGHKTTDTVECILADKTGKWLGTGIGDILDFTKIYQDSKVYENAGNYIIEIEQAMRYGQLPAIKSLEGIVSVGVCVRRRTN